MWSRWQPHHQLWWVLWINRMYHTFSKPVGKLISWWRRLGGSTSRRLWRTALTEVRRAWIIERSRRAEEVGSLRKGRIEAAGRVRAGWATALTAWIGERSRRVEEVVRISASWRIRAIASSRELHVLKTDQASHKSESSSWGCQVGSLCSQNFLSRRLLQIIWCKLKRQYLHSWSLKSLKQVQHRGPRHCPTNRYNGYRPRWYSLNWRVDRLSKTYGKAPWDWHGTLSEHRREKLVLEGVARAAVRSLRTYPSNRYRAQW